MRGYPNRSNGWWYRNNQWSYSWTVANALRLYLASSKSGLRAREVKDPKELQLGMLSVTILKGTEDIIIRPLSPARMLMECLVNAHTYNSRMRYWSYEDSSAYTDKIQYKFFTIVDDY